MRKALRRAATSPTLFVLAALLFMVGGVGGTVAAFTGETQNKSSTFAGGWIGAPSTPTVTVGGYDAGLNWTPGTHGPVTGQQLWGVDQGTTQTCTGATYTQLSTSPALTATTPSYLDKNRGSGSANGDWYCYRLVSTSATVWTAANNPDPAAIQLGLVATTVVITNGRTGGSVDKNDTVKITFNQRTNLSNNSSSAVCTFQGASGTGVILLGDTTCLNVSSDPYTARLTGLSVGGGAGTHQKLSATLTVSTSAPWTVLFTVGANGQTASGTAILTPSSTVLSYVTSDQASACTASKCQPTATGTGF